MYATDNGYLLKATFQSRYDVLDLIMVNVQDYNNKSGYECF